MSNPEIIDCPANTLDEAHPILANRLIEASRVAHENKDELLGDSDAYIIASAAIAVHSGERFRPIWSRGLIEQGAKADAVNRCSELITRHTLSLLASRTANRRTHYLVGAHGNVQYRPRRVPKY